MKRFGNISNSYFAFCLAFAPAKNITNPDSSNSVSSYAMLMEDRCVDCNHMRENHMPDSHTGRTECDFPSCNCHEFRE